MMDWKDRQHRDRGELDGIAMAMLSAGLTELNVDRRHSLWSYTHQLSIDRGPDGSAIYRIVPREQRQHCLPKTKTGEP